MRNLDELLDKYVRLIVRVGVNLQREQLLVINAPIECASFARSIAREAYAAGAHDVIICWKDEQFSLLRYQMAKKPVFMEFPEWRRMLYMDYAEQGAAFISILAEDPEVFRSVEPERLKFSQQAAGAALLEYRQRIMKNENSWCVVSIPTEGWAKAVFPQDTPEDAAEKLWQKIFAAVRINEKEDPLELWREHAAFLQHTADFMNRHAFVSLHYKNKLGTNLMVELPEGHIWAGGAEYTKGGIRFIANMPTEEIYTLPKRDGVHGTVVATKPLNYNGNIIDDFRLTFERGKVISYQAGKGEELLQELLSMDEGASYLGEVALVPYDSPISRSGVLFFNTLFDENASCHLAFGKAYPTCIKDGDKMQELELVAAGANESLIHEDFMIGSRDLQITGRMPDGNEIVIFRDGNFVI
jgi:aminopeptidase